MTRAAIGLGSNLGDRLAHLRAGAAGLRALGRLAALSSLYESAPVGPVEQGPFLNAVAVIDTSLGPEELLAGLLRIEARRGRERRQRWGPRPLDLDLLVYGGLVVAGPGLAVPHPHLGERRFVVEPLAEVWPDAPVGSGRRLGRLLVAVSDQEVVRVSREEWPPLGPDRDPFVLDCRDRLLDCIPGPEARAQVMGILNVTPDSFFDGGRYEEVKAAVARAEELAAAGAAIIDIGGESTRPGGVAYGAGAAPVSADEELTRVVPVVAAVREQLPGVVISVDTYKPAVAQAALAAGAHVVNDVTGLRLHPEMAEVVAAYGAALVVMHSRGRPGAMPHEQEAADVVDEVVASLARSVRIAEEAGVGSVVVDPGFGFGKTVDENFRLLRHTSRLLELGRPVLIGVSRKSSLGAVLDPESPAPPAERLFAGLGAAAAAVAAGAALVRTHDVAATVETLRGLEAVRAGGAQPVS